MEIGDLIGLVPGFYRPDGYAALIGITPASELIRLVILVLLAGGIVGAAAACVYGLSRKALWTPRAVAAVFSLYVSYGAYQLLTAAIQLQSLRAGVAVIGLVYILVGVASYWVGMKGIEED